MAFLDYRRAAGIFCSHGSRQADPLEGRAALGLGGAEPEAVDAGDGETPVEDDPAAEPASEEAAA